MSTQQNVRRKQQNVSQIRCQIGQWYDHGRVETEEVDTLFNFLTKVETNIRNYTVARDVIAHKSGGETLVIEEDGYILCKW